MDADPIIEITGLRKRFGDHEVLKGVDLAVRPGEVLAVIGRSGSGKSTLLRCINGLEAFEAGTLKVDGQPLRGSDARALRELRQRVGMIFQGFNLFPHLGAGRNIMLAP
jgi:polar amino acid transport system ATP-binding protein